MLGQVRHAPRGEASVHRVEEQRHPQALLVGLAVTHERVVAETLAVVRGHDPETALEKPPPLHALVETAQLRVGEADLRVVAIRDEEHAPGIVAIEGRGDAVSLVLEGGALDDPALGPLAHDPGRRCLCVAEEDLVEARGARHLLAYRRSRRW